MLMNEKSIKGMAINDCTRKGGKYVANWRVKRPEINLEKCVACGLCVTYCPEGAIERGNDGKPVIDYRFCKGCGVCAYECPQEAIIMLEEGK